MCCVHFRGAWDPARGHTRCSTGAGLGAPGLAAAGSCAPPLTAWRSWTHASWMCCVHFRGACDPAWGHTRCLDRAGLGAPGLAAAGSCAPPLTRGARGPMRGGCAASTFEVRATLLGVIRGARPGRPGGPRARGGRVVRACAAAWARGPMRGGCAASTFECVDLLASYKVLDRSGAPGLRPGVRLRCAWRSWTHASWMFCVHFRVRATCLGSYEVLDRGSAGLAVAGSCAPPLLHGARGPMRGGCAASTFEVRATLLGVIRGARPGRPGAPGLAAAGSCAPPLTRGARGPMRGGCAASMFEVRATLLGVIRGARPGPPAPAAGPVPVTASESCQSRRCTGMIRL